MILSRPQARSGSFLGTRRAAARQAFGLLAAVLTVSGTTAEARQPAAAPSPAATAGQPVATHSARFARFAVAADHPLASEAGAEMLRAGGNAVDAAVATAFALSVVRPFSCGIGGGGFMIIHLAEDPPAATDRGAGLSVAMNYREQTPAAIDAKFFEDKPKGASTVGGLAVAVPGTVAGLLAVHLAHGHLDRAAVLAPAIRLARAGFEVDAAYRAAALETIAEFEKHPDYRKRFAFTWERFLGAGRVPEGFRLVLPEQASALELIARDGMDAFYKGPIAAAIVRAVQADGGVLTADDLARFAVESSEPLVTGFAGYQVLGMPLPSSGGVAMAETLGLFERAGGVKAAREQGFSGPYTGLLVECFKHAFADRARWLGDGADHAVTDRLLEGAYLDGLARRIDFRRAKTPATYGSGWKVDEEGEVIPDDAGTSHLSVLDAQGHAVACTETINLTFGSYLAVPEYGFILNNQMDDFTTRAGQANAFGLRQSEANRPGPGKRPLSSMTPTIVRSADGRVAAVAGASGGPRIITATTQALLNALLLKMPADEAVAHGRFHHQWQPNLLFVDERFKEYRWNALSIAEWMRKTGNATRPMTSESAVQLIVREEGGGLHAASDPRKGGRPAGQ